MEENVKVMEEVKTVIVEEIKKEEVVAEEVKAVIAEEIKKEEVVEAKKEVFLSCFIDKDKRERIEVDILFDKKTGRVINVVKTNSGVNLSELTMYGYRREWFDFACPSYDDLVTYRSRASKYDKNAGMMIVDNLQIRMMYLVWLLKDWSLCDKDGKKIELAFERSGILSDESIDRVYKVAPSVLDMVLSLFESDVLLQV